MKMISLSIYSGFWFSLRFLKHLVRLKVGLLHSGEGVYCWALLDNKATFFLKKTLLVSTLDSALSPMDFPPPFHTPWVLIIALFILKF